MRVVEPSSLDTLSPCAKCALEARKHGGSFYSASVILAEPSTVSSSLRIHIGPGQSGFSPFENTMNTDVDRDRKPYQLNADIQPMFPVGGERWVIGGERWERPIYSVLHVVPRFRVRILANDAARGDSSSPVRTPSYMPGLEYFISAGKLWNPDGRSQHYFSLKAWHHSNGQDIDGGEFREDGFYNTRNGDFSEQLVLQASYGGVIGLIPGKSLFRLDSDTMMRRSRGVHSRQRIPGSLSPVAWKAGVSHSPWVTDSVKPYFGNTRVHLVFTRIWAPRKRELVRNSEGVYIPAENWGFKERWRLDWRLEYIADEPAQYRNGPYGRGEAYGYKRLDKRLNLYGTLYYVFPHVTHTGLFLQAGYYGSDPYNAYFQESQWFWRIGIAMSAFIRPELMNR